MLEPGLQSQSSDLNLCVSPRCCSALQASGLLNAGLRVSLSLASAKGVLNAKCPSPPGTSLSAEVCSKWLSGKRKAGMRLPAHVHLAPQPGSKAGIPGSSQASSTDTGPQVGEGGFHLSPSARRTGSGSYPQPRLP